MVWVSCIFLFESVGMWTKGAFLCKVFFLFCSLHNFDTKSVDRWTSNENSFDFIISFYLIPFKILTKKVDRWTSIEIFLKNNSTMYVLLFKCVDNNVSFYFMFSLCHVPFTMLKKSVDRWTSNKSSEKMF